MSKIFCIITASGIEVIDSTPKAEDRLSAMDFLEKRFMMQKERKQKKRKYFGRKRK